MAERKVRVDVLQRKGRNPVPAVFWSERDYKTNALRQRVKTFKDKKKAELFASLKYVEINSNVPIVAMSTNTSFTWDTLKQEFLAFKRRRNITPASIADIENTLVVFESAVGKPSSTEFCQKLIDKFIDYRLSQVSRVGEEKKISPFTINKDLRNLKSFILWGKDVDYFRGRFRIHPLKIDKKAVRRLSNEEVKALITGCTNPELRLGIIIAVYSGLREGDIWALKRNQLNTSLNCFTDVVERKGRKVTDKVQMAPVAVLAVSRYISSTFGQPTDNIFKQPFPRDDWDKIKPANSKFHDLRKTCLSTLGGVSKSGWVATRQGGHSTPQVTDGYMNVDSELLEAHNHMPTSDWGLTG